ncbi:MAG: (deoxy)nucleoside triphosphate pyrophosphohydrolase [Planctomycetota bacterium]|nr:(deoxy)nucleoside triphosphate pyrophosphohydrolase [Planctomycetota bacterium]
MRTAIPIAIAVVERDQQVLIGRRSTDQSLGGYWEFPGGKVESHETPEDAAIRECREETSLTIEVTHLLDHYHYDYEHARVDLHFFAGQLADAACQPAPPFRWVPRRELTNYAFPAANAAILRQLQGPN